MSKNCKTFQRLEHPLKKIFFCYRTLDIEAQLLDLDQKIREALSVIDPRKDDAKSYLDKMSKLVISGLMIKKNPHVVDAIKKVSYSFSSPKRLSALVGPIAPFKNCNIVRNLCGQLAEFSTFSRLFKLLVSAEKGYFDGSVTCDLSICSTCCLLVYNIDVL